MTIVDTDVHPLPVSGEVLKSYAPAEWKDKLWPTGNAVSPVPHFYDTPDSYKTMSLRVDAAPPGGGVAGSDPDFAAKQLLVDAGVSIALLEPMCDAQLPAGRTRPQGHPQRLAGRRVARREQLARTLAGSDQRHRSGSAAPPPGRSSAGPAIRTWPRC